MRRNIRKDILTTRVGSEYRADYVRVVSEQMLHFIETRKTYQQQINTLSNLNLPSRPQPRFGFTGTGVMMGNQKIMHITRHNAMDYSKSKARLRPRWVSVYPF
jgi:hypothetical protein